MVFRDVVRDQIQIGSDDSLTELSGLGDIDSLVDLVGIPNDVGLAFTPEGDLGVIGQVLGISWQFIEAHETNALDVWLLGERSRASSGHDLRTSFMRAKPRDIDCDRQVVRINWCVGEGCVVGGTWVLALLEVHCAGFSNDGGFLSVRTGGEPPVMPEAPLRC